MKTRKCKVCGEVKPITEYYKHGGYYDTNLMDLGELPSDDVVEVVRCKDCKYAEVADSEDSQDGYICQFHRGCIWFSGSYCSWGER